VDGREFSEGMNFPRACRSDDLFWRVHGHEPGWRRLLHHGHRRPGWRTTCVEHPDR
jgi:hypothetical protein